MKMILLYRCQNCDDLFTPDVPGVTKDCESIELAERYLTLAHQGNWQSPTPDTPPQYVIHRCSGAKWHHNVGVAVVAGMKEDKIARATGETMSIEKENVAVNQTKRGSYDQLVMFLYGYLCGLKAAGWTPKEALHLKSLNQPTFESSAIFESKPPKDNKKIWTFIPPAQ